MITLTDNIDYRNYRTTINANHPRLHIYSNPLNATGKDVIDNQSDEQSQPPSPPVTTPILLKATQMSSDDYNQEAVRLQTFTHFPCRFLDVNKLARTGFYYLGQQDACKCQFCKIKIGRWEPEDDEITEHLRWSPNCPLLKRRITGNVPICNAELEKILPPASYDVCGTGENIFDIRPDAYAESSFTIPAVATAASNFVHQLSTSSESNSSTCSSASSMRQPEYPEYAIETARLRSFDDWPKTMKQKPKELSDAGFFYTQTGDRVKCFSCGGGLRDWDESDVPWEQHALWFGHCDYLNLIKGTEYIEAIKKQHEQLHDENNSDHESGHSDATSDKQQQQQPNVARLPVGQRSSQSSSDDEQHRTLFDVDIDEKRSDDGERKNDSKLCKICYSTEYNTAFFPCGHVVACAKCASSVTKCPMCRKPFERVMRVFFS